MRWSFITSAIGTTLEVGRRATKNHRIPKAIGRVSRRRDVTTTSHSALAMNTTPTSTRPSSGLAIGVQSVSALRLTGSTYSNA